jgi:hypothetical protein
MTVARKKPDDLTKADLKVITELMPWMPWIDPKDDPKNVYPILVKYREDLEWAMNEGIVKQTEGSSQSYLIRSESEGKDYLITPLSPRRWKEITKTGIVDDRAKPYVENALDHYRFRTVHAKAESELRGMGQRCLSDLTRALLSLEQYQENITRLQKQAIFPIDVDGLNAQLARYQKQIEEVERYFAQEHTSKPIGHKPPDFPFLWLVFDLDTIVRHFSNGEKYIYRNKQIRSFVIGVCGEVKELPKETSADDFLDKVKKLSDVMEKKKPKKRMKP